MAQLPLTGSNRVGIDNIATSIIRYMSDQARFGNIARVDYFQIFRLLSIQYYDIINLRLMKEFFKYFWLDHLARLPEIYPEKNLMV